jgi:signal transduction histidine kinase
VSLLLVAGLAWIGWSLALAAVLTLLRRRAVEADAAHELRGAAAAIGLAVERLERGGSAAELGPLVRLQLARVGGALSDLGAPAAGGSPDLERLAQVIANVAANAAEHGVGAIDVSARRAGGEVRLEVRNRERGPEGEERRAPGRGRGLAIARRAARALGGRLVVESEDGVTRSVIELPAPESGSREGERAASERAAGQGGVADGAPDRDDFPRAA